VEAARPCSYYQRTYRIGRPTTETIAAVQNMRETGPLLPEEAYVLCRERGVCPYEATKLLARNADVVVGNYNHILVEPIRQAILSRSGPGLEEINCVVDEAHGLPEYASAVQSDELTLNSVVRTGDEVEDYNIEEKGLIRGLEKALRDMGREAFDRAGRDNEHLVPKHRLLQELESEIGISSEDELSELLAGLESYAADVRSTRLLEGKPPFSYFGRAADFLRKWLDSDPPLFVHYAKASVAASGRAYEALGVRCLARAIPRLLQLS
jgi:Rad3-related DNA helicase